MPKRYRKTDFNKIVNDLIKAGLTGEQIAERTGVSGACISRLKTGKRGQKVDYDFGVRLLALKKQVELERYMKKQTI